MRAIRRTTGRDGAMVTINTIGGVPTPGVEHAWPCAYVGNRTCREGGVAGVHLGHVPLERLAVFKLEDELVVPLGLAQEARGARAALDGGGGIEEVLECAVQLVRRRVVLHLAREHTADHVHLAARDAHGVTGHRS
jgi:hypothetical protein